MRGIRIAVIVLASAASYAQLPMEPVHNSGQSITAAYEGWFGNPDGTFSILFGYYNRNSEEVIDIPIGPDNFVSPGPQNQGQPSRFYTKRNWGVLVIA